MTIEKIVRKTTLEAQGNDFAYWQAQPYELRLATLERIRREYHAWKYDTEPRLQRVLQLLNANEVRYLVAMPLPSMAIHVIQGTSISGLKLARTMHASWSLRVMNSVMPRPN